LISRIRENGIIRGEGGLGGQCVFTDLRFLVAQGLVKDCR